MKAVITTALAAGLMVSGAAFAADTGSAAPPPVTHLKPAAKAMGASSAHRARMVSSDGSARASRITTALNLLEGEGYADFSNFHAAGNAFAATVTQNGKTFQVTVDPDSGRITRS
jgi:hypothetical protein